MIIQHYLIPILLAGLIRTEVFTCFHILDGIRANDSLSRCIQKESDTQNT